MESDKLRMQLIEAELNDQGLELFDGIESCSTSESLHNHSCGQIVTIVDGDPLLETPSGSKKQTSSVYLPPSFPHRHIAGTKPFSYYSLYLDDVKHWPSSLALFQISDLGLSIIKDLLFSTRNPKTKADLGIMLREICFEEVHSKSLLYRQYSPEVSILIEYINEHYTRTIRISELRSLIPFSERHIRRIFQNEVGKTVTEYLREIRLKRSKELIQKGYSIIESSLESGYDSLSSFYRDYSKFFKETPKGKKRTAPDLR